MDNSNINYNNKCICTSIDTLNVTQNVQFIICAIGRSRKHNIKKNHSRRTLPTF